MNEKDLLEAMTNLAQGLNNVKDQIGMPPIKITKKDTLDSLEKKLEESISSITNSNEVPDELVKLSSEINDEIESFRSQKPEIETREQSKVDEKPKANEQPNPPVIDEPKKEPVVTPDTSKEVEPPKKKRAKKAKEKVAPTQEYEIAIIKELFGILNESQIDDLKFDTLKYLVKMNM